MTPSPSAPVAGHRFPLLLAGCLLGLSLLAVVVSARQLPAGMGALEQVRFWLGWLCGDLLSLAIVVGLTTLGVRRRGTPPRMALALVVATLTYAALAFFLALLRAQWLAHWVDPATFDTRGALMWLALLGPLQMLVVAAISLVLAWAVGGRGEPVTSWSVGQRRLLGGLIALGACAGLIPLLGQALGFLDVSSEQLRSGLPALGLTVGLVHGAAWALGPARRGSGVAAAWASSLLVGPALLLVGVLAVVWGRAIQSPVLLGSLAGIGLLACPLLAWAICRGIGHWLGVRRQARSGVGKTAA